MLYFVFRRTACRKSRSLHATRVFYLAPRRTQVLDFRPSVYTSVIRYTNSHLRFNSSDLTHPSSPLIHFTIRLPIPASPRPYHRSYATSIHLVLHPSCIYANMLLSVHLCQGSDHPHFRTFIQCINTFIANYSRQPASSPTTRQPYRHIYRSGCLRLR